MHEVLILTGIVFTQESIGGNCSERKHHLFISVSMMSDNQSKILTAIVKCTNIFQDDDVNNNTQQ